MDLADIGAGAWVWLILAAFGVGFAKTAIGGVASLSVVVFAAVLPTRESTGALLPLLIVGDIVAVTWYHRHGSLATLLRLLPGVVPGLLLGTLFVGMVDDGQLRVSIGLILVVLSVLQLGQRYHARHVASTDDTGSSIRRAPRSSSTWAIGGLAGFTTMTANAAGPVMAIYLIRARMPMLEILGTGAWFFLAVNLAKVPFSAGLSLISGESLVLDALLVPALLVGALVGTYAIRRIAQQQFEYASLALGAVAAALLLI